MEFETDSNDPSRGDLDFLNEDTPPGKRFGSSKGERRLRLRLAGTGEDSPSTTVFRFNEPTPAGHFAFVLGDIDVDEVIISGRTGDGAELTASDLGFRSTFNFCNDTAPMPDPCEDKKWTTEPEWRPADMTLRGSTPGDETEGASGWFLPETSIKRLTFRFVKQPGGGFPSYRLWFVGDDVDEPTPTPTPSPTPTPTPTPTKPTKVPLRVTTSGPTIPAKGTTKVIRSIKSPGRVTQRTVCTSPTSRTSGQVRLCSHSFNRTKGSLSVRTFGRPVRVKVTVRSTPKPADRNKYRSNRKVFTFRTK